MFVTYVGPTFTEQIDNFEAINTDKSSRKEVYNFISYVKEKTNHIDCIVCNAGMTIRKSFTETKDEDWDKMMEVAVNSHYIMLREFSRSYPMDHAFYLWAPKWDLIHMQTFLRTG